VAGGPSVRATQRTEWFGSPASPAVSRPASALTGDVLVAFGVLANGTATATAPAGWALRSGPLVDRSNDSTSYVWTKVAATGEPTQYGWGATGTGSILVIAVQGADTASAGAPMANTDGATVLNTGGQPVYPAGAGGVPDPVIAAVSATPPVGTAIPVAIDVPVVGALALMLVGEKNFGPVGSAYLPPQDWTEVADTGSTNGDRIGVSSFVTTAAGTLQPSATGAQSDGASVTVLAFASATPRATAATFAWTGGAASGSDGRVVGGTHATTFAWTGGNALASDGAATGTTWYFSPTGDDATGAGTFANPWKTIAKAVAKCVDGTVAYGDTCLWIGSGTISETQGSVLHTVGGTGSLAKFVHFICQTPWAIRFEYAANVLFEKWYVGVPYVHIEGFYGISLQTTLIENRTNSDRFIAPGPVPQWVRDAAPVGIGDPGGDHFRVVNCRAENFNEPFKANRCVGQAGVLPPSDPNMTGVFSDCWSDLTEWGIGLFGCESCMIRRSKSTRARQDGIQMKGNCRNCVSYANTIVGDRSWSGNGIMLGAPSGATGGTTPNDNGTWAPDGYQSWNCVSIADVVVNPKPFVDGPLGGFYHGISLNGSVDCGVYGAGIVNTKTGVATRNATPNSAGWQSDLRVYRPTFVDVAFQHVVSVIHDFDADTVGPITEANYAYYDCPAALPSGIAGAVTLAASPFVDPQTDWHAPAGSQAIGAGSAASPRGKFNWNKTVQIPPLSWGGQTAPPVGTPILPWTPDPTGLVDVGYDRAGVRRTGTVWDVGPYQNVPPPGPIGNTIGAAFAFGGGVSGASAPNAQTGVGAPAVVAWTGGATVAHAGVAVAPATGTMAWTGGATTARFDGAGTPGVSTESASNALATRVGGVAAVAGARRTAPNAAAVAIRRNG
jgi:hypothetical protein